MIWRTILEVVLGVVAFALGANFWALVKAPSHLRRMLGDGVELAKIVAFFGPGLREDAALVKPVLGSYAGNISAWQKAHFYSLQKSRNFLLVLTTAVLVGSYFLGFLYLAINLGLFLLPAVFPLPASAVNNNVNHLRTIAVNLIGWHAEDPGGCQAYCAHKASDLQKFHELLVTVP